MIAMLAAVAAAYGMHLLYTSIRMGWSGLAPGPTADPPSTPRPTRSVADWMNQAGLGDLRPVEFVVTVATIAIAGAAAGFALFGSVLAMVACLVGSAAAPIAIHRQRRRTRLALAQEAWPRMIEELRLLTGSVGRSLPQALFEVGANGPEPLRCAFDAARREWLLTTDFERTLHVLRERLADPTCDATCETLLIAHELGGTGIDRRLADLAQDRRDDVAYRKDVRSRQSGVRFARRFVLIVPLGMAAAGLSVGNGRSAYTTPIGQLAVVAAIAMMAVCWMWAGSMLRLPTDERVFTR